MILKGSQRGGANALADHLQNLEENEHVELHELKGFASGTLSGAMQEASAVAKGTRCCQFLFSLSLSPPQSETVPVHVFEQAIERAESKLGLTGQPRAIIFHEKEGRRHAHVVWSRIDTDKMTAINLPFFKRKLNDVSKNLYLEHGWQLPDGFKDKSLSDPANFTLEEWQQAKRAKQDPRVLKSVFRECWSASDNRNAFAAALHEKGFHLAKGDRRGFVALDYKGEVYSITRWTGQKTKEVAAKLGDPEALPSVADTKDAIASKMHGVIRRFVKESDAALEAQSEAITFQKNQLKVQHQSMREKLADEQTQRWEQESQDRAGRFRGGIGGVWDWINGRSAKIKQQNELEAWEALKRDRAERDDQIAGQLAQRRELQESIVDLRKAHAEEVARLNEDVAAYMEMGTHDPPHGTEQNIERDAGIEPAFNHAGREQDRGIEL